MDTTLVYSRQISDEINDTIELQETLLGLDGDNLEESKQLLIRKNYHMLECFPLLLNEALLCRRKNVMCFSLLLKIIYDSYQDSFKKIKKYLFDRVSFIDTVYFPHELGRVHLLRICYDMKLIPFSEIFDFCVELKQEKRTYRFQACFLFIWFLQEFYERDSEFTSEMFYYTLKKTKRHITADGFQDLLNTFYELRENDWTLFKELIKQGYTQKSIAGFILDDDCDSFQHFASDPKQVTNNFIPYSFYFPKTFFFKQFNFANFAAFCGSVKCYKYILLNFPFLEKQFYSENASCFEFAVAGGSSEIIHIREQNNNPIKNALGIAAHYHWNSIFSWLVESKSVEITYIVLDSAAISNNLWVFINYFDKISKIPLDVVRQALNFDHLTFFKALVLSNKFDINSVNSMNWSILHYASLGKIDATRLLCSLKGIKLEEPANDSLTPFLRACKHSSECANIIEEAVAKQLK